MIPFATWAIAKINSINSNSCHDNYNTCYVKFLDSGTLKTIVIQSVHWSLNVASCSLSAMIRNFACHSPRLELTRPAASFWIWSCQKKPRWWTSFTDEAPKDRSEASLECWSQDCYDFHTRLAIIVTQVHIKWDLDKITDMTMEVESLTTSNM